jgi:inhibitor of cysteine peptidase
VLVDVHRRLVAGRDGAVDDAERRGGGQSVVTVTAADSGKTVDLGGDQRLVVRLESNPSTGYRWNVVADTDAAVLRLVSTAYEDPQTGGTTVGAPGTEVWTYEAAGAGTTAVRLAYYRLFGVREVARRFALTVRVG